MTDEEEEGVVCHEGGCDHGTAQHHDGCSGSSSLSSLLVDLHKSFVDDFGQHQVVPRRHACQQRRRKDDFFNESQCLVSHYRNRTIGHDRNVEQIDLEDLLHQHVAPLN